MKTLCSKCMTPTGRRIALLVCITLLAARSVHAFVLSGQITDSAGNPLPRIQIQIFDDDVLVDDLLGVAHTDPSGNFSATLVGGWGVENPDIYIQVGWSFLMIPASTYNFHHMILRGTTPSGQSVSTPYVQDTSSIVVDHDPTTDLVINLQKSQALTDVDQLRLHINEALDYYNNNKGAVPWSVNYDIPVLVRTATNGSAHSVGNLYIASADITGSNPPGVGQGFVSDIFHETGHLVHYRMNGDSLPPKTFSGAHSVNTESDPGFAVVEGWPSYVALLTAQGLSQDNKYAQFTDMMKVWWRGNETPATAYPNSTFESGEIVEGALGGVWYQLHLSLGGFSPNFSAMFNGRPNDIFNFVQTFVTQAGGAGSANALLAHQACQDHGIVYTRAEFQNPAFDVNDPPNTAPPEDGNFKELGGKTFARGKLKAKFQSLQAANLGVQTTIPMSQVRLGAKRATIGSSTENNINLTIFSPIVAASAATVDIDSSTLGANNGYGEWDFLILSDNRDQFTDSLTPSWNGDGTPAVASNEQYLKTVGTWFDKDRNPATLNDGYIVVDNTAPVIKDFKP